MVNQFRLFVEPSIAPENYEDSQEIKDLKQTMSAQTRKAFQLVEELDKNWVKGSHGEVTKVVLPRLVYMLETDDNPQYRKSAIEAVHILMQNKATALTIVQVCVVQRFQQITKNKSDC